MGEVGQRSINMGVIDFRRYFIRDFMGLSVLSARPICGANAAFLTASALHKTHEHKKGKSRVFAVFLASVS